MIKLEWSMKPGCSVDDYWGFHTYTRKRAHREAGERGDEGGGVKEERGEG